MVEDGVAAATVKVEPARAAVGALLAERAQRRGAVVRVDLTGNAANVRLLDWSNYRSFRADQRHRFVGGHYK